MSRHMPSIIRAALIVSLLATAAPSMAQQMPMMQLGMSNMPGGGSELLRQLLPSVVSINVRKDVAPASPGANASAAAADIRQSFGTGFVIDPSGVIATNSHVVQDAWQIDVTFSDGSKVPAHLLNATRLIDVAVIKVDVGHPLPVLHWGDSDTLQIGDPVFTMGNGLGVGISVSGGIVSGLNRNIMDSPYDDYIQTDAAINHGNSGGPMFNTKGEVVGINTALISATTAFSGIGLAIPARNAQVIIDRLMNYGWLRPGWIGVKIQQLTPEMGQALRMDQAHGSIVANVNPDGPADKAGLRVGDVILRLGTDTPSDERALLRGIATAMIGKPITLGIWRDGRQQTLDVPVQEWPRSQWEAIDVPVSMPTSHHHIPPDLGIALAPLDDATRTQFGLASARAGVVVTSVAPGTDAAQHGLAAGDVVLRVQEKPVATTADAQAAIADARSGNLRFVLVLIEPKVHRTPGPEWMALRVGDD